MNRSSISLFLIRLIVISLSIILFYVLLFSIISLPQNLPTRIILVILALCAADYTEYYLVKKGIFPIRDNSYDALVEMVQQSLVVQKIHGQKPFLIVLIFFGVYLILGTVLLGTLSLITETEITNIGSDKTSSYLILIGIILAPILETLLFQMIPIELLCKITPTINGNRNHLFPCLVSAVIFALVHNYSASYMMLAFCMGLCFASVYTFVSTQKERNWKDGFLWTMIFHMAKNTLALLLTVLE